MKLLYFNDFQLGVLKNDNTVVDVMDVVKGIPHTGPHDLINGLIERFGEYKSKLEEAAARGKGVALSSVRIRPPLPKPYNIDCMAVNYMKDGTHDAPAPSDAVVLFDGKDFSKWKGRDGDVTWKIENGYMEVTPKSGVIRTKDEFGDFQLHLEWATPVKVEGDGQGRGNNGVNIFGRYEVQILDSYDNITYADGQAGALYGQFPPRVNASKPPGEWQTYDIIFEGARWDDSGKLTRKTAITVIHNGCVLHHRTELHGGTTHRRIVDYNKPHPPKGSIELYEHGNPVRFRNIWIRPLGEYDQGKS